MNLKKFQAKGKRKNRQIPFQFDKFLTVRVISHGPISLKIVVLVGDTLLKFQYFMNNSLILWSRKILE